MPITAPSMWPVALVLFFTALSFILAPFIFNPGQFVADEIAKFYEAWWKWLLAKDGWRKWRAGANEAEPMHRDAWLIQKLLPGTDTISLVLIGLVLFAHFPTNFLASKAAAAAVILCGIFPCFFSSAILGTVSLSLKWRKRTSACNSKIKKDEQMDDDGSDVLVLSSLAFFVTLAESCVVATVLLTCRESFDDDDGLVNPDAAKGAGKLRGIDATRAILRIFVFKYFSSRVFLRLLIGLNPLVDFLTAALLPASPPSCLLPTVRILKEVASDMAEAFAFVGDTLIMHLIMLFVWFVAYVGSCVVICLSCGKFDIASLHSFALFRVQPSASLKALAEGLDEAVRETVRGVADDRPILSPGASTLRVKFADSSSGPPGSSSVTDASSSTTDTGAVSTVGSLPNFAPPGAAAGAAAVDQRASGDEGSTERPEGRRRAMTKAETRNFFIDRSMPFTSDATRPSSFFGSRAPRPSSTTMNSQEEPDQPRGLASTSSSFKASRSRAASRAYLDGLSSSVSKSNAGHDNDKGGVEWGAGATRSRMNTFRGSIWSAFGSFGSGVGGGSAMVLQENPSKVTPICPTPEYDAS